MSRRVLMKTAMVRRPPTKVRKTRPNALSPAERLLIEKSGLFDAEWYLRHAPEADVSRLDPLTHYATIGWKNGRSPGPSFDTVWYRSSYNDVAAAEREPLLHFLEVGRREGRAMRAPEGSIFDNFQSLGEDCEFGFVQQQGGSEQLGLFRFSATTVDGLIAAFDCGLENLFLPRSMRIIGIEGEYQIAIARYGMRFHTSVSEKAATADAIKTHETRRLQFLLRKFLEDLKESQKIFVFASRRPVSLQKLKALTQCLRRFGSNRVMYVTVAQNTQQCGTVKALTEGLTVGYIDRLAGRPSARSMRLWTTLCRNALDQRHVRR